MGTLEDIANAAKNFAMGYDHAMWGYKHPGAVEADLETLEDTIRTYRDAQAREQSTKGDT